MARRTFSASLALMKQGYIALVLLGYLLSSSLYADFGDADQNLDLCLDIETGNFEPCQLADPFQEQSAQVPGIETGNIEPDQETETN